jgi:Ca2+-binding RTX toxin-like protein
LFEALEQRYLLSVTFAEDEPLNNTAQGGSSDAKRIFVGTASGLKGIVPEDDVPLGFQGVEYNGAIINAIFGSPTISRVEVNANAGNDIVRVGNPITQQSVLNGGTGDDIVRAGGGGNDRISGGSGRDRLLGDAHAANPPGDTWYEDPAGAGVDLLITGFETAGGVDTLEAALLALIADVWDDGNSAVDDTLDELIESLLPYPR